MLRTRANFSWPTLYYVVLNNLLMFKFNFKIKFGYIYIIEKVTNI